MTQDSTAALKALAEPRRVAMLRLVRDQPRSVGEIAGHFEDITQQAVSQHLRELREAGLVAVHRDGQRRMYMLRPEGIEDLESFLRGLWPAGVDRLSRADDGG
jgi:DNA-binding transcriptional ArsR family regulator